MARKGQKFNKYSEKVKQEIMEKYLNNEGTANSLSKEYNISLRTVKNWVNKINKKIDITVDNKYKRGRRKEEMQKERYLLDEERRKIEEELNYKKT